MKTTPAELLHDTSLRAELSELLKPHTPEGEPWVHIGGYLGRSVVMRCGDKVLKCFFHAAETKWQRELRAYTFLADAPLPVPRLYASGRLRGELPWLLVSLLPGQMGSDLLQQVTEREQIRLLSEAGALLAQLHGLPVDARLTEVPPAQAARAYPSQLARRLGKYGAQGQAPGRLVAIERARVWATELLRYCSRELACTHGDFSMRNLLVQPGGGGLALSGLIDFERCEYADPAVDFARLLVAYPAPALRACSEAYAARGPNARIGRTSIGCSTWSISSTPSQRPCCPASCGQLTQACPCRYLPMSGRSWPRGWGSRQGRRARSRCRWPSRAGASAAVKEPS
jgi:aminoglycoside phosphotransferase